MPPNYRQRPAFATHATDCNATEFISVVFRILRYGNDVSAAAWAGVVQNPENHRSKSGGGATVSHATEFTSVDFRILHYSDDVSAAAWAGVVQNPGNHRSKSQWRGLKHFVVQFPSFVSFSFGICGWVLAPSFLGTWRFSV
jgi:hypothetical protein